MGTAFLNRKIGRVLIVAPSSVVPVWPKEFDAYADFPFEMLVLSGSVSSRISRLSAWAKRADTLQVAVINYEAVWRMVDAIKAWQPDMIICDESSRIKSAGARQSKALHKLAKVAKYRMILTGTPVTQGPLDLFSQYNFLSPGYFGASYYSFRARYANMIEIGGPSGKFKKVVSYKNLDELVTKAHAIAFRITKAEALDLPEQIDVVRNCTLEPAAAKVYREMVRESVAELESETVVTASNVLSRLLRLSQIAGGFLGDDERNIHKISTSKIDLLEDVLEDVLDAGKKVVIFVRFIPELTAIESLINKKKVGCVRISGDVRQEDRGELVRRFQEDEDCRVFIAQIQTAGLGLPSRQPTRPSIIRLAIPFPTMTRAEVACTG